MPGLKIAYVREGSIAAELGLEEGDTVTSVNGQPVRDLIDFTFACADDRISLTVIKKDNCQQECVL